MSNFPSSLDIFAGTVAQGTNLLTSPDHSQDHRNLGSSLAAVENFLGTNGASNVFGGFTSNQQAVPINSGTLGTTISNGTFNNGVLGSPTTTSGTLKNPTIGTPNIQNGTLGTASILGGTATALTVGSTSVLQPLNSAFWVQPTSPTQTIGTNSTAQVIWGSAFYDLLNEIGTTNSFIAKQAGIYQFFTSMAVQYNGSAVSFGQLHQIRLNGTIQQSGWHSPDAFTYVTMWQGSVPAGGTVDVAMENSGTAVSGTITSVAAQTSFYGKRVF